MEFSYTQLKQMDVIGVADGKNLGRGCDLVFDFPGGRICGFIVTGGKGFRLMRDDFFIPLGAVVGIGEDVIITNADRSPQREKCRKPPFQRQDCRAEQLQGGAPKDRRSYDEYE